MHAISRRLVCLSVASAIAAVLAAAHARADTIVVGSKNFSEQALLGEILAQHLEARTHLRVERRFYLAGTYICQQALLAGRIDTYVEYTGTALTAILHDPIESDPAAVFAPSSERIQAAIRAGRDAVARIQQHFCDRGSRRRRAAAESENSSAMRRSTPRNGAPASATSSWSARMAIRARAECTDCDFAAPPRILDLGLLYRALLESKWIWWPEIRRTGLLAARDLVILEDDKHYFPPYEAVPIVREDTLARHPEVRAAIAELAGKISDAEMRKMNYEVDGEHRDAAKLRANS